MHRRFPSQLGWGVCLLAGSWVFSIASGSAQTEPTPAPSPATELAPPELPPAEPLEAGISTKILDQPVATPFRRRGLLRESSRPVYVITHEQMQGQGSRTVQEALRYLPGVLTDGTAGTQPGTDSSQLMRGARTAQVLILLDGRPINDLAFTGGFDLSRIPTDAVERIEVSPGGGSTLYGSDAVGGVINIISRDPGTQPSTTLNTSVGSYGLNEQRLQNRGRAADLGWVIGYSRFQTQNDFPFTLSRLNLSGVRDNAAVTQNNLQAKLTLNASERQTFSLNTLYLSKDLRVPGSTDFLTPDARQLTHDLLTDLTWDAKLGEGDDSALLARLSWDHLTYEFSAPISLGTRDTIFRNNLGIQLQHTWELDEKLTLTTGGDYRSVSARNTTFSLADGSTSLNYNNGITQGALFARLDYGLDPRLNLNLGLRQDYSSLINGSATSPSLGLVWVLSDSTQLRANYASSFRTPLMSELYFKLRGFFSVDGNPNLKPERGESIDFGIDQQLDTWGLLRLTVAHNRIRDGIAFVFTGESSGTYENIDLIENTSLDAVLDVQLSPEVTMFINYTLNDPRIRQATDPGTIGKELNYVGADSFNLGFTYQPADSLTASLRLHQVGSFFTNNSNSQALPGYTTVRAQVQIPINEQLRVEATVDNLFDHQYEVAPGYPGIGRTVRVGLQGQF